jgi:hypothetical protein
MAYTAMEAFVGHVASRALAVAGVFSGFRSPNNRLAALQRLLPNKILSVRRLAFI